MNEYKFIASLTHNYEIPIYIIVIGRTTYVAYDDAAFYITNDLDMAHKFYSKEDAERQQKRYFLNSVLCKRISTTLEMC